VSDTEKNITERNIMRLSLKSILIASAFVFFGAASVAEPGASGNAIPPPAECSKSSLTGDQFLDMFYAIAMHGDLRDIPFIEKTLQVKFQSEYELRGGKTNIHNVLYHATSILNAPIYVTLDVSDDNDEHNLDDRSAILRFHGWEQCLQIPESKFQDKFGGDNHRPRLPVSWGKYLNGVGKNNARMLVGYVWQVNPGFVSMPGISQMKPESKSK
jgi:hypothetical protein